MKKIVLDPLEDQAFFIHKTEYYDQWSVMNWPFYEMIARNIPPIEFDEDYKTELSENDKAFVQSLYGESFGGTPPDNLFVPLIEFECTGSSTRFSVTTTKNLGVRWDYGGSNDYTVYDLPAYTTSEHTFTINKIFDETKTRRIVIGEVLDYGEAMPDYSYALTRFDFKGANNAGAIDIKPINHALSYIRIIGGSDFSSREFNFTGYEYLKELYLVRIGDSKVILDNCPNLETFATSRGIWKPEELNSGAIEADFDFGDIEPLYAWPDYPDTIYSLSDTGGLTILNCNNLKQISLENTELTNFNFGNLPALEYVYLSSFNNYIVGGTDPYGKLLLDAVNTLPTKAPDAKGSIVLRGIAFRFYPSENETGNAIGPITPIRPNPVYDQIPIDRVLYNSVNQNLSARNWNVVWDSGVYHPNIP